jgi:LmbE family N-acetylglucosaminyl deacetylase
VKSVTRAAFLVLVLATLTATGKAQFSPAPGTGPGLAETVEAIDSARVTTRILYVTAHPDDESSAVLTYLARGLHADVALLSLTRGEGGQNALGPEQAPQLGLIRTQELLAATHGYGVKLYFTRAKDFGFSKTPEETERIWGDQVLQDMVRIIRTFRPNIVINNWGDIHRGHGHHQAAGLLTPQAVKLAADPSYRLPAEAGEPFGTVPTDPWPVAGGKVQVLDLVRGVEKPSGYVLPLDEVSPLYGKSYREIGTDAFVNHRTQGVSVFLGASFFRLPIALQVEGQGEFDPRQLAVPLSSFPAETHCAAFAEADRNLADAASSALRLDWPSADQFLAQAAEKTAHWESACPMHLTKLDPAQKTMLQDIALIRRRIERALSLAAGLEIAAQADRSDLVAGEEFHVRVQTRCRTEAACALGQPKLVLPEGMQETKREGDASKGFNLTVTLASSASARGAASGRPLRHAPEEPGEASLDGLLPEPPPLVKVAEQVTVAGYTYEAEEPVTHIQSSSTRIDRVPLRIVPAYTLAVEPKQAIEPLAAEHRPFEVLLRVHSYSAKAAGVSVGLDVPAGWSASSPVEVKFDGTGDRYAKLTVTPPGKLGAGNYTIAPYVMNGGARFSESLEPLPSMPTILWEEPAQCIVHAFDINLPKDLRVGYITAEQEPVPDALKMLGIHVDLLDPETLAFGDLSRYDAIVVGVRAYELRSDLPGANQRLFDYVSNGGTLLVQYQRDFAWDRFNYAPYPAKIDSNKPGDPLPRITDENSLVRFLKADDPLLNQPNKITLEDFKGWVQERGLYFWSQFDPKYTPLLAMHDPGEKDLDGGLVYTKYGKGTYIYTGIAFFRQLPEGVPGAYRLFVNLLSASRAH